MNIRDILQKRARTPEQAEKEKSKLEDIKAKLEKQINDLEASIPQEKGKAGDEVLNNMMGGGSSNEAMSKLKDLQAQLEGKKKALERVKDLLPVAQANLYLAQAADKRKEAEKLRKQANEHESRTNELLAELEKHEGCEYAPKEPERTSHPVDNLQGGAPTIIHKPIPRTQGLLNQASDLEREAQRLEITAKQGKQDKKPYSIIGDISKLEKAV